MRILMIAPIAALVACHDSRSVYDEPLPQQRDAKEYTRIADQLRPDDRPVWTAIAAYQMSPGEAPLTSGTVGEAIQNSKAQAACLQRHAIGQESAGDDVQARNREIDAYNDCLQM